MKKVLFLLGPTAVGKTSFGVKLAQKLNGEIISADSVQIFKGLDIGSAKVTKEEMQGVTHYGIDICSPQEEFSVFDFVEFTKKKIDEIIAKGKLPIVVGGTGLYIKALTLGYDFGNAKKDEKLRAKLENLASEKGTQALFDMLKSLDEEEAKKIDKQNKVRLIRAIEIATNRGTKGQNVSDIDALVVGLVRDREKLYQSINSRVDLMMKNGFEDEVKSLKEMGISKENQCMRAIGYKEMLAYLDNEIDKERMIELTKQHSRNYAKRQLTFLRGMENVHFVDVEDKEKAFQNILSLVESWNV